MTTVDRRSFLKAGGITAGATLLGGTGLQAISMRMAQAAPGHAGGRGRDPRSDYGPIRPTRAVNTRDVWLSLPAGFQYSIFSKTGSTMTDGRRAARAHDGMGAFGTSQGIVSLVRNQEIRFNNRPRTAPGTQPDPNFRFNQGTFVIEPAANAYDLEARGGTTTLRFDARQFHKRSGGLVQDFVSLTGTVVNCAGGIAYRKSGWLTCEEIVQEERGSGAEGTVARTAQKHGYVYLTPLRGVTAGKPAGSRPLVAMGRFAHEAAAVDDATGIVYMTEDAGSGRGSGFYRFLPTDPADLSKGGVLQILGVRGREAASPAQDLREGQQTGRPLPVAWVTIDQPDPDGDAPNAVFEEGFAKGAAKFNRLEGCWDGADSIFFASTSGGDAKNGDVNSDGFEEGYGQIWEYNPSSEQLVLLFESPDGDVLDSPDNIVVSPRGGLVICEDDASSANLNQDDVSEFFGEDKNRLIGLTLDGTPFPFAENIFNDSELAGACWSDDGRFLFVNIYGYDVAGSGGTLAITGPWQRGAL